MLRGGRFGGPLFYFLRGAMRALLSALLLATTACRASLPEAGGQEVHFVSAPDGTAIQWRFRFDRVQQSPEPLFKSLLVTIHEAGSDNTGWAWPEGLLASEGHAVVRWDLRGHGVNPMDDGAKWHASFEASEWARCADDLVQVVHAAKERAGAATPVILAGEGFGALLALDYAKRRGGVAGVVMVSPPREAHGLDGVALISDFNACPVLILASENDATRYPAAMAIQEAAPDFSEIRIYPGSARGTTLLGDKPDSMNQLAGWIDIVLQPKSVGGA